MKTGKTLTELAIEIERQAASKKDYLVNVATALALVPSGGDMQLVISGGEGGHETAVGVNPLAHEQFGEFAKIPRDYYKRMQAEQPDLLAQNVNTWFRAAPPKQRTRLLRVLDGKARAFVSNSYRPLDYMQLAESILPVLSALELEVISCDITERRLYFKAVDRRITRDIPSGRMGDGSHTIFDTVSPAIVISNSEVGCGSLSVETAVWIKACTNLAIFSQRSLRKYHLGSRADLGEEIMAMLSDDTRRKTDAALWAQVRDVVRGAFELARFDASLGTADNKIEGDPVKVVELTGKRFGLSEPERTSVLQHLIRGGDLSQYGLFNAVTRAAEDVPDYDRATEFERLGGKLIELPRTEWEVLAKAA